MTMTTQEMELRLDCLRQAVAIATAGVTVTQIVGFAYDFWGFVSNSPVPNEPPADFGGGTEDLDKVLAALAVSNDEAAEIEAVARAIETTPNEMNGGYADDEPWRLWIEEARAAIEALDRVRRAAARVDGPVT